MKTKSQRMKRVLALRKQIEDTEAKIESIQNKCKHPPWMVDVEYGANTGNYDPSADCYWTDCHCRSCGKEWTEDNQDRQSYASKKEWEDDMKYRKRVAQGMKKILSEFGMKPQ